MKNENSYALAGWLAITSCVIFVPNFILSAIFVGKAIKKSGNLSGLGGVTAVLLVIGALCSLYAFYKFKHFLNEYYSFHENDTLFTLIISGALVVTFLRVVIRMIPSYFMPLFILIMAVGIPLSIVGIVFGNRLLKLESNLHGYLKPLSYFYIISSICFLTIILTDLGIILNVVFNVLMGIILLKGKAEVEVDFV